MHIVKELPGLRPRCPEEMSWQILVTQKVRDEFLNLEHSVHEVWEMCIAKSKVASVA